MIENNFLLCLIDLHCSLELILSTVELAAEVIFELLTDSSLSINKFFKMQRNSSAKLKVSIDFKLQTL